LKTALRLSVNQLNTPEEDFPSQPEAGNVKFGYPDVDRNLRPRAIDNAFGLVKSNLKSSLQNYPSSQFTDERYPEYNGGTRKRWSEFIGKRNNKRMSEFLGKRMSEFIGKRMSEFIGKRMGEFLGKRSGEWLG